MLPVKVMMIMTTVKRHDLKINHLTVIGKKHFHFAASVTLAVHTRCFRNTIEKVLFTAYPPDSFFMGRQFPAGVMEVIRIK